LKVACVVEAYPPHVGGSETRMSELLTRLPKNWDIHVVTPRFDNYLPTEAHGNITIHRVGHYDSSKYFLDTNRPIGASLRFGLQASIALRDLGDFDVGVFGEWNLLHFVVSERTTRMPTIVDWCEVLANRVPGPKGLGESLLERYLATHAKHHTAINSMVAADLMVKHGVKQSMISVVPNGVRRDALSVCRPQKVHGRVLYVGRITPHKQLGLLLQVARLMSHYEFRIVGTGDPVYTKVLMREASDNVRFLGGLSGDRLTQEYRGAWVFVLPSVREGSSISALEAMANYTPVVTVKAPLNYSVHDVVQHMANGLVVDNTVTAVVEAIRRLESDDALYRMLADGAYRTAEERCWDALSHRFAQVIEHVALQ
jgi:glycosyltransferase involved in cell wall biosynthesis